MTTVSTKAFLKELEWTARFSNTKTTIPILSTVKLAATASGVTMEATDLELAGSTEVSAASDSEWSICVPVKALLKYLKKVDESEITLSVGRKQTLVVKHGEDDGVSIFGMSLESFPEPTWPNENAGYLSGLDTAIPRVLISISQEESRFTLNGALLVVKNGLAKLVSTDGHRLSLTDIGSELPDVKLIVPKSALSELARIIPGDGPVAFASNEDHMAFTVATRRILARKLTGNFPDYERVMPKVVDFVEITTKDLQRVIDRVSTFADERSKAVEVTIDHAVLTVSASISETGAAKGSIKLPTNGVTYKAGFNHAYMTDAMKQLGEKFQFGFTNGNSAAQLSTDGFAYVVMPMRI